MTARRRRTSSFPRLTKRTRTSDRLRLRTRTRASLRTHDFDPGSAAGSLARFHGTNCPARPALAVFEVGFTEIVLILGPRATRAGTGEAAGPRREDWTLDGAGRARAMARQLRTQLEQEVTLEEMAKSRAEQAKSSPQSDASTPPAGAPDEAAAATPSDAAAAPTQAAATPAEAPSSEPPEPDLRSRQDDGRR